MRLSQKRARYARCYRRLGKTILRSRPRWHEAGNVAKLPDLRKALDGRVQPHHRLLLARILAHIDFLEQSLTGLEAEIEQYLAPFAEAMELVQSVVGIAETAAASIIAEIGTDMSRFASDKHIAGFRWNLSGEQAEWRQAAQRQDAASGNKYLRSALYEVAWTISRTKDNYLSAFYHRMVRRRGKKKAITAVAHKVLVIVYHILRTKTPYKDLGADYFESFGPQSYPASPCPAS
jgi:transposase